MYESIYICSQPTSRWQYSKDYVHICICTLYLGAYAIHRKANMEYFQNEHSLLMSIVEVALVHYVPMYISVAAFWEELK